MQIGFTRGQGCHVGVVVEVMLSSCRFRRSEDLQVKSKSDGSSEDAVILSSFLSLPPPSSLPASPLRAPNLACFPHRSGYSRNFNATRMWLIVTGSTVICFAATPAPLTFPRSSSSHLRRSWRRTVCLLLQKETVKMAIRTCGFQNFFLENTRSTSYLTQSTHHQRSTSNKAWLVLATFNQASSCGEA